MIQTYPEMNRKLVGVLLIDDEDFTKIYAAHRIEELEKLAIFVRDTLESKKNEDRTSWSLWNEANKLVPRKDTP